MLLDYCESCTLTKQLVDSVRTFQRFSFRLFVHRHMRQHEQFHERISHITFICVELIISRQWNWMCKVLGCSNAHASWPTQLVRACFDCLFCEFRRAILILNETARVGAAVSSKSPYSAMG